MAADDRLPAIEMGTGGGAPVVFLHGFGGAAAVWQDVQSAIAKDRATIAFDLPGHAGAKEYPGFGPPKLAARAVAAELQARGIGQAHLVGHSMGGAVAAIVGLLAPERVASLVLLAPGGFGPEIDAATLRGFMDAAEPGGIAEAYARMGAPGWKPGPPVVERMLAVRAMQDCAAIAAMFDAMFSEGRQGMLPLDAIATKGFPVALVWGDEDRVTPFPQSRNAPAAFTLQRLEGVGHMLMDEAPDKTIAAIRRALRTAEAR